MGCGCGSGGGAKFEVTKGDGTKITVNTLAEAQAVVARVGGTYKATV
jgi:hypothetical protein